MKNILKNILFSILTTALLFTLLESGCRIRAYIKTKDPYMLFYGRGFFELKVKCLLNRTNDLIAKGTAKNKYDSRAMTIATFGGSTTKCTPYVKAKDSWPTRLEYHLKGTSNQNVAVVNRGYTGADCNYDVGIYKDYLLGAASSPRIAIFYIGLNDSTHMISYLKSSDKKIAFSVPFAQWLNARFMQTSLLYASIKEKYCLLVKKDINSAWSTNVSTGKDIALDLAQFEKDVQAVIKISNDFHIKLILCVEPISTQYLKEHPDFTRVFDKVILIMRDLAKKNNIDFQDMNKEIYLRNPEFDVYYVDFVHPNEKGNDLVAQYFADYISRKGYLN